MMDAACIESRNRHIIDGVVYQYPVETLEAIWDRFERLPGGDTEWFVNAHIRRHGKRIDRVVDMRPCCAEEAQALLGDAKRG